MPPGPRHLLLVRHGESVWNAERRWQGQADPPLSRLGEAQAADAAQRLAPLGFSAIVASDLVRARRTAEILAAILGLPVQVEPGLREIDVGDWSGLTRPEIEAGWPGELADWSEGRSEAPPGGESRHHLASRARGTIVRVAGTAPAGDRLLLVTHGALIRNLDRALGLPPQSIGNLVGRWYAVDGDDLSSGGELVWLVDPEERTVSPSP